MNKSYNLDSPGDQKLIKMKDSYFKGHSIILQPLGDASFLDILPQYGKNNNNFMTFLSDDRILVRYAGNFIVLDTKGRLIS